MKKFKFWAAPALVVAAIAVVFAVSVFLRPTRRRPFKRPTSVCDSPATRLAVVM